MTSCGDKKTEAVRLAMQMEDDGYKMYIEGAEKTTNPLGKKMLLSLARDEEAHKKMVEAVARGLGMAGALAHALEGTPRERLRTVFSEASEGVKEQLAASPDDLEVLNIAVDFEKKSNAFYNKATAEAEDDDERGLFERLALEESEHCRILQDVCDYLKSTGWWFLWEEGAFMDGF
ncbi:MAG: ferritin family protein [Planctomycetia bacterium]|nr:ferritin family protein [Planctomycetia bacterium]